MLENEVVSTLATLGADANAMKQTCEEAQHLVEETRESVKELKGEVFGGEDGEEEREEEQEEEEEGGGEEGPEEDGDGFKSELFGIKLHD